jgi:hypothetical protein
MVSILNEISGRCVTHLATSQRPATNRFGRALVPDMIENKMRTT